MEEEKPQAFVAPCRSLEISAPFTWLLQGFRDVFRAPLASLSYGFVTSALIMCVVFLAMRFGSAWVLFSLLCGFVFLAPIVCLGIYAISAQLERDLPVSFMRTLRASFKRHLATELVFALVLLIIFLIWARASSVVSIFLPAKGDYAMADMLLYSVIFMVIALIFLSITFTASVFSLPMIMHRDVDAITAVVTSINAVLRNKAVMMVWGLIITMGFLLGILTAGVGLVVFIPAVGHAVWRGYLETIDADEFPRHKGGVTAIKRADRKP